MTCALYIPTNSGGISKRFGKKMQGKINKIIEKIIDNPYLGKPLKYELEGLRSVRVPPFQILLSIQDLSYPS